jgi:hypothetical protein
MDLYPAAALIPGLLGLVMDRREKFAEAAV